MGNPEPTAEPQLQIRHAVERLRSSFAGHFDAARIERLLIDSLAILGSQGSEGPLLIQAERFTRDRLRALLRMEPTAETTKPAVLFLCIHNAGRSQMAAGWARHLAGAGVEVFSGGSEPAAAVNQAAVSAMEERGIDISEEMPLPWSDEIVEAVDVVVTMGCGDACPVLPGKRYIDWELEDPAGKPLAEVRPVRDDIEQRVRALVAELLADSS